MFEDVRFSSSQSDYTNTALKGDKIFIPGKSTRGVTISKEENAYSIGINVIASEEDFWLALDVTKAIASLTGGDIIPEDADGPVAVDELTSIYDQKWIDMMKLLAVNMFLEKVGQEDNVLSIGCCLMSYMVGPKVHAQLDTSSELAYYESLVRHIQQTQVYDVQKYYISGMIQVSSKDESRKLRYVMFFPGGGTLVRNADYVSFPAKGGKYELPYSWLSKIATDKFTLVDEEQYKVEPLDESEYEALLQSIEKAMDEVTDPELEQQYSELHPFDLDLEFNRLTSIPDARIKIFALRRMTALMAEYDKRGLELPHKREQEQAAAAPPPAAQAPAPPTPPKPTPKKVAPPRPASKPEKKPWWKFW